MSKKSISFYALHGDLVELLATASESEGFKYAQGADDSRLPLVYESVLDIPHFSKSQYGDQVHEAKYLLIPMDAVPIPRPFVMSDGRLKNFLYPVDQPSSVRLIPGGIYVAGKLVVAGEVSIITTDAWSQNLFKVLRKAFTKHFKKINGVYVGGRAYEKFKEGYRLNASFTAPLFTDLIEVST